MSGGVEGTSRVVVITGAAQGLGRAYALRFASMGHRVVAVDVNIAGLAKVVEEVQENGGECLSLAADIGDPGSVGAAAAVIGERFGRADVLINNAAIFTTLKMRPFEEIPLDEWSRVLHVNVTGTMLMTRAVTPLMRQQGWGRIINVSSAAVIMGRPHYLH